MKLPVGIDDFKDLIEGDYLFADKTLLIKDIIDDGAKVILITRPRRFGKTLNLSMLYYFLSKNHSDHRNLFEGLEISKDTVFCKKHQQQYPVIFITFKEVKKSNFADAYSNILVLIKELYGQHRYLLEGDVLAQDEKNTFTALLNEQASKAHIETAIKNLAVYMERKFKKAPIILIDEYDTPIQESYLKEYYDDMVDLMRSIFGQTLKGNKALKQAVVTGITRIAQESLFSGLNNLEVYSLLREKYGQYFGFTEEEVLKLLASCSLSDSLSSIKEWYNGYQIGKYILYNPWSIIKCLKDNGDLKPYWVNTSSNELIYKLLSDAKPEVKQQFEKLLQGKVIEQPISENLVFTEIKTQEEALWALLFYAGYLKVLSSKFENYQLKAKIAIPNKEVGSVYAKMIATWFTKTISLSSYDKFVQSLANEDVNKFKEYLSSYIMQTGSYFDFNSNTPEQIFHIFVLGLVVGLRDHYSIRSNRESGLGRYDVMITPKDKNKNGIVLEFKICNTADQLLSKAQEALDQAKSKGYIEDLAQQGIKSTLVIGLAFCGKQVELAHEVINC